MADQPPALPPTTLDALRAELDRVRGELAKYVGYEPTVREEMQHLRDENDRLEDALDRIRALHEHTPGADGTPYCALCAGHGDIEWPCATIAATADAPHGRTRLYIDGYGRTWTNAEPVRGVPHVHMFDREHEPALPATTVRRQTGRLDPIGVAL